MIHLTVGESFIRDAELSDVDSLQNDLRKKDIDEIWASHNHTPRQALLNGYELSSNCYTIVYKGQPVAMFGVAPGGIPECASVWLLGTDKIADMKKTFMILSKTFIPELSKKFGFLFNFVDIRNKTSILWLKKCGAKFGDAIAYGEEQRLFVPFSILRKE